MEDLCVAAGMNRFSFHAFVSWSPVIEQFGHSLYGPIGASVTQEQIDDILARAALTGRRNEFCATMAGPTTAKSGSSTNSPRPPAPTPLSPYRRRMKKIVRGRFQLLAPDGQDIGTLAAKDGRAWGLGAFLRRCGAKFGDQVTLPSISPPEPRPGQCVGRKVRQRMKLPPEGADGWFRSAGWPPRPCSA